MARAKTVHVVWDKKDKEWRIKMSGKHLSRAYFHDDTKEHAIRDGKQHAKFYKCELVIHGKNGKIQRKHSYGNDPKKSKG